MIRELVMAVSFGVKYSTRGQYLVSESVTASSVDAGTENHLTGDQLSTDACECADSDPIGS